MTTYYDLQILESGAIDGGWADGVNNAGDVVGIDWESTPPGELTDYR